jgi:hypothetical protein
MPDLDRGSLIRIQRQNTVNATGRHRQAVARTDRNPAGGRIFPHRPVRNFRTRSKHWSGRGDLNPGPLAPQTAVAKPGKRSNFKYLRVSNLPAPC